MKKSRPRVVFVTKSEKKVYVTFIHTDNFTVRAEVTADRTPGLINAVRNDEDDWVVLEDSIDRSVLFDGAPPSYLPVSLEQIYREYLNEQFTT